MVALGKWVVDTVQCWQGSEDKVMVDKAERDTDKPGTEAVDCLLEVLHQVVQYHIQLQHKT